MPERMMLSSFQTVKEYRVRATKTIAQLDRILGHPRADRPNLRIHFKSKCQYPRTILAESGKKVWSALASVLATNLASIPSSKNPSQTWNWSFVTTSSNFCSPLTFRRFCFRERVADESSKMQSVLVKTLSCCRPFISEILSQVWTRIWGVEEMKNGFGSQSTESTRIKSKRSGRTCWLKSRMSVMPGKWKCVFALSRREVR